MKRDPPDSTPQHMLNSFPCILEYFLESLKLGGGTDPPKNDKIFRKLKLTGIFRCSFLFKNRGKFWFLPKTSFDPPYGGSENLKIPIKNRNFKVVLP